MINNIIDLLNTNDFYGKSETIDIAKGKYAIPYTWKQGWKSIKRIWKSKK
jgi:hypothetical protein